MQPLSSLAMRSTLKRSVFSPTRNSGLVATALPLARLSFWNRTNRSKSISRKFRNIQEYHQNHRWILFVEVMGIVGVIASASTLILGFVQERDRYRRQRKEEDDLSNRAERDVAVGETWLPKGIGLVQKGSARAAQFFTWGGLKEKSGEEKGSRERREKDEQRREEKRGEKQEKRGTINNLVRGDIGNHRIKEGNKGQHNVRARGLDRDEDFPPKGAQKDGEGK